jgi:DNA-binding transcriptional LysR family regulator
MEDGPTLDNLRCFLAAAEHLNFRRASEQVFLTPTAFSQRIKQLEEQLGRQLFERTTRTVRLTTAGVLLLEPARAALREARRCVEVVHGDPDEAPTRFTVGTRFELGMSWIVPSLLELRAERPAWTVDMFFGSGDTILEALRTGRVDCVITSAPVARSEWEIEFLHRETYAFVAAPSLLERAPIETLEQASAHTLLDISPALPLARYLISAADGSLDFPTSQFCGTAGAVRAFAVAGVGVAVLPEYMITDDLADGALTRLLPEITLLEDSFRLMWRADAVLADVLGRFAAWMRERPLR